MTKRDQDVEFLKDSRTLWVNGPDGLMARFGVRGIDIHVNGSCAGGYCTPGLTTIDDWRIFKQKMAEIHDLVISDQHMPARLTRAPEARESRQILLRAKAGPSHR